jgi:hypothetical protein
LDSSVLFTAVNSSFGGSAKLFTMKNITLHASNIVLHEVEKNVRKKLGEMYVERFLRLSKKLVIISELPNTKELSKSRSVIADKDSAILSQFIKSACMHLITLDKRDFLQPKVIGFAKPKKIWTPKMFFDEMSMT